MHAFQRRPLAATLSLAAALVALPAAASAGPPDDPLNPQAAVPPARHDTSLARYRPAGQIEVAPWKATNDAVGRIGGWRAYAREASAPPAAPPRAASAPAPAASAPAGAHQHHHPQEGMPR